MNILENSNIHNNPKILLASNHMTFHPFYVHLYRIYQALHFIHTAVSNSNLFLLLYRLRSRMISLINQGSILYHMSIYDYLFLLIKYFHLYNVKDCIFWNAFRYVCMFSYPIKSKLLFIFIRVNFLLRFFDLLLSKFVIFIFIVIFIFAKIYSIF